jgi:ABC-type dipeptide/oligopeptide/nickel transport system ATPase component
VEIGPVKEIFAAPKHAYTRMLIESLPSFDRLGAFRGAGARADTFLNRESTP